MGGVAVWQAGKSQKFTLLTCFCNFDDELLGAGALPLEVLEYRMDTWLASELTARP